MAFTDEGIEIEVPAPQRVTLPERWPDESPAEQPAEQPDKEPEYV